MGTNVVVTLACIAVAIAVYVAARRAKTSKYPPGPAGWPLIGNLLDMPTKNEWVRFRQWGQEYKSDVLHLNVFGTHIIVLNTLEAVSDLMEKRTTIYSSRPPTPMLRLMGLSWTLAFMPTNSGWRAQRRYFRQEFEGGAIRMHYPSIANTTKNLLQRYLDTPQDWQKHIRHMVAATIFDVIYGIEVLPVNDPYIKVADDLFGALSKAIVPGAFLVDTLPILRYLPSWMPGAGFKRKAKAWTKLADAVFEEPFRAMAQALGDGIGKPCFCSRSLEEVDGRSDFDAQKFHIQAAAGGMYGAGSDTTVSLLETFMLAMVLYPEVQAKAQAEIDLVLGSGRLPTFGDERSLPYLAAVMMECHRWRVFTPSGVPHMVTADDEYKGYLIPKGAIVIANSYQILNDEAIYPEPLQFRPERFLRDGKIDPTVRNPAVAAFGYGGRIWYVALDLA